MLEIQRSYKKTTIGRGKCWEMWLSAIYLFTQQYMGTWPSSELGECEDTDEEEWYPTSVTS